MSRHLMPVLVALIASFGEQTGVLGQQSPGPGAVSVPQESTPAATPDKSGDDNPSEEESLLTYYYINPQPEKLPEVARWLVKTTGENSGGNGPVFSAFFARIMAANPDRIDGWLKELGSLPKTHRRSLWRAAVMSGVPAGKDALRARLDGLDETDRTFVERTLALDPPDLLNLNARSARELDVLWASFFASGDVAYIRPIIRALELEDDESIENNLVGSAASWSLRSNAWQHSRVLTLCREESKTAAQPLAKKLGEIIKDVEKQLQTEPCPEPKQITPP